MLAVARTDAKEEILDAVVTVIVRDGLEGASLRTVANEADVSLGLLGYHFSGKQALLLAAFSRAADRWVEAARTASHDAEVTGKVAAFLAAPFEEEDSKQLVMRLTLWAGARNQPALAAVDERMTSRNHQALRRLLAGHEQSTDATELGERVTDVLSLQNGLLLDWARTNDREALDRGLARCLALALPN